MTNNNKSNVMTLGIFAHANAGKTTITEQLLVHTGIKKKTGRVDYGNTTTDNLKVERERGISVRASLVTLPIDDVTIQLIDTPGHADFSAEVERAINVLDGAVLVVSGVEGVEPQTQIIWKQLQENNIPTIIFINKMDRMGADYDKVVHELQAKLSDKIIPIANVKQVDDKLKIKKFGHSDLVEELSTIDETTMEKYINEEINDQWIDDRMKQLSINSKAYYVIGGSALSDEGITMLVNAIKNFLPTASRNKSDNFSGYVYTVKRENNARELYIKVMNGTLKNRQSFVDEFGNEQRIRTLTRIKGDKRERTDNINTGEIGIVTGLTTKCGDFIGEKPKNFHKSSFVNPLLHTTVNIEDKSKINDLVNALQILYDEDPSLNLKYNKVTNQISIELMGLLQSEIIENLLAERFGLQVTLSPPIIIQKETPSNISVGKATYDRVSEVEFKIEPLPLGSGLVYESLVSTDYLYAKYQKQIEKLVKHYAKQGLFGWEVTDCKISLINGKSDSVCSDPSHYNVIVPLAIMRSIKNANMRLLEPVMEYTMIIPEEYYKRIISCVSFGEIDYDNIKKIKGNYLIPGKAELRKIIDLPIIITRITSGHGSVVEKPAGFCLSTYDNIIEREYIGPDPRNETIFMMNMNSSPEHVDRKLKRK